MAELKSRATIILDFKKAKTEAGYLKDAARTIRNESKNIGYCRQDVKHVWQGDNAHRFTVKMDMLSDDLDRIARQLENAADVIISNAKTIYDAEMEAKRIADTSNHS